MARQRVPDGQQAIPTDWQPPDHDASELRHRFGDSVLLEFIRGHSSSDVLRELVQNEYDAGGSVLQVMFGDTGLEVTGKGTPIDTKGWRRLSVTLGTGTVPDLKVRLKEKANGIGSKNFGLRSLFLFGDRVYVRSNGYQTLLDLQHGTPIKPSNDATTIETRGVRIHVPYRTKSNGTLNAFTVDTEAKVLDDFVARISPSLLKLARHDAKRSLRHVIVSSTRKDRRIEWRQNVKQPTAAKRGMSLLVRRITMKDSKIGKKQLEEEFEWQKRFKLPEEFHGEHIPGYFRDRGPSIRIGISLRTKRGKIHPSMPAGIAYYPIGVPHAYTGNSVSISAPFEMDADRSKLVDPSNSAFNMWLLRLAADMTVELLHTDWFNRFGANAYRAVRTINRTALPTYSEAVETGLKHDDCWPSRSKSKRKKRTVQFDSIQNLNIVPSPSLDHFLDDRRYLHSDIYATSILLQLVTHYGAKEFTVNSLIRLRCAGKESNVLQSICKESEACYYYVEFPEQWKDLSNQQRCATALDEHSKQLSNQNRHDLAVSGTTLTASGSLAAAKNLWIVPSEILDVCPVPAGDRLHPELSQFRVLKQLCQPFDVANWIQGVIGRLDTSEASEDERISLYKYLVSVSGRVPRKLQKVVRNSPVLRDRKGIWVSPKLITAPGTTGIPQFRPALHLPHQDYATDKTIAKKLCFKNKLNGDDVVRFAEIVSVEPEKAQKFEQILERSLDLLTAQTIDRLASIEFIRSNGGKLRSPSSLYLDTPKNRACIGPSGPYPSGNAKMLFVKLRCHSRPTKERMFEYLTTLRQNGQPPQRPDVFYPELVDALKRESVLDKYEHEEILWTGTRYSAPADTILGGEWNKIFLGMVPSIKTSSETLKRAYRKLGVYDRPERHHWEHFFVSFGERYREEQSSLISSQRNAMRAAYLKCDDMPSLPSHVPWMLDDVGYLHATSDAESGHFVVEDDVPLGTELRNSSVAVSFTDNTNPEIASFFRRQGVKLLTEIRKKVRDRIGKIRPAPSWFREKEYVRRLAHLDFKSALVEMVARDTPENPEIIKRVRKTAKKLSKLKGIVFVNEICTCYRVCNTDVAVSATYAWTDEIIHLTWVPSRSGLEGVLASLIARECLPDGRGDHARFSDSVFRLIACETSRDVQEYLKQRGIRWDPTTMNQDEFGDYMSDVEEAILATIRHKETSLEVGGVLSPRGAKQPEHTKAPDLQTSVPLTLPPIEEVNAQIVQPSGDWSYSPSSSGSSGGGGSGWSPRIQNEERDREIGRRGEEIVYMLEKVRLRKAGFQEDHVVWVSNEYPASNFDIESVDDDGKKLFIEVKTTTGSDGKFHWSKPEFQLALQAQDQYILYRVYLVSSHSPIICPFRNPVALISWGGLHLDIESFRAQVQPNSSDRNM